jgi:hypothetical protein
LYHAFGKSKVRLSVFVLPLFIKLWKFCFCSESKCTLINQWHY